MKISTLLSDYEYLAQRWRLFDVEHIKQSSTLRLKQLTIKYKQNRTYKVEFNDKINYLSKDQISILRCILTGKIHSLPKDQIEELILDLSIDERLYKINLTLGKTTTCIISDAKNETSKSKTLKEIKVSLNRFFEKELNLPYLKRTNLKKGQKTSNPITFATYFTFCILNPETTYQKVFLSMQSNLWRKRVLQILLGLRGIPIITFFTEELVQNNYNQKLIKRIKEGLEIEIKKTEDKHNWQKTLLKLFEQENSLKKEKQNIEDMYSERKTKDFKSEKQKSLNNNINKVQEKLQNYKTKELLILNNIKVLGASFSKRRFKTPYKNRSQHTFSIPESLNEINKEKTNTLIGEYYLNLSHIEITEQDLKGLKNELDKAHSEIKLNEAMNSSAIDAEIHDIGIKINNIIAKEDISLDKEVKENQLLLRDLRAEKIIIEKILTSLRLKYKDIHTSILKEFLESLTINLSKDLSTLRSITLNRDYTLNLITKENKLHLRALKDNAKLNFTKSFYKTLINFSSTKGTHPKILLIEQGKLLGNDYLNHYINTQIFTATDSIKE